MKRLPGSLIALAIFALYPMLPGIDTCWLGVQLRDIFIFAILACGLHVVVGLSGQLHLGIAAFFGIGAYITGILTVEQFPFRIGFWPALAASAAGAGVVGALLALPTLRLRGDYIAIVTLGFGEVIKFSIKNLENITKGSQALNPLPSPVLPGVDAAAWDANYRYYYYLALVCLALTVLLLRNLERSPLGRGWLAVREDELAGLKLSAFALGAALAGVAGSLYAVSIDQTGGPDSYTFNRSVTVLCFLIIGGLGSLRGALLGAFVLMGYDNILTFLLDGWIQKIGAAFRFADVKLIVFGLVLILMMRFRPEGILPARRPAGRPPATAG
jgi:branched-chain amino acid transport system permease protein